MPPSTDTTATLPALVSSGMPSASTEAVSVEPFHAITMVAPAGSAAALGTTRIGRPLSNSAASSRISVSAEILGSGLRSTIRSNTRP
ncbi:MAG: hypothetical protein HY060_18270 [Proteobacteria bacterium]|nr:hypothetical protein [Pseudomonadota bacterium]